MFDFIVAVLALAGGGDDAAASRSVASDAPAALVAEDQTPTGRFTTATEIKPILGMTRANWVAVREWDGQDLVYVTHLWAWRCGLLQMEVAVNGADYEVWPLPDCHTDTGQPNGITDTDGLPYRAFALEAVQGLSVRLTYDDLSVEEAEFTRKMVLQP